MDRNAARTRHMVEVVKIVDLAPHMRRIKVSGDGLATMPIGFPGQWVKVFFPCDPGDQPHSRAYTIRHHDRASATVDLDFVLHGDEGGASRWASRACVGDILAVAGPRDGLHIDPVMTAQILIGDSTALPAISAIMEALPRGVASHVFLELTDAEEAILLPDREVAHVQTCASGVSAAGTAGHLEEALRVAALPKYAQAWVAGEAGMVQAIRALLSEKGFSREAITASGYWREGVADHRHRDSGTDRGSHRLAPGLRRPRQVLLGEKVP